MGGNFFRQEQLKSDDNKVINAAEKETEKLLHFYSIVDQAKEAIISETLDGIVLSWNCAAEKMYGYDKEYMIGRNIMEILPIGEKEVFANILDRIKNGEKIKDFIAKRTTIDGKKFYISAYVSPVKNFKQETNAVSIFIRNITEKRENIKKNYYKLKSICSFLVNKEKRNELAVLSCCDGIWDIDIKQNKIFICDRVKHILNIKCKGNTFTLNKFKNLINYSYFLKLEKKLKACLKEKSYIYEYELKLVNKLGKHKYISFRGKCERDNEGNAVYIAGTISDITSKKQEEDFVKKIAYYSNVTGLYNRAHFVNNIPRILNEMKKNNEKGAFIFIDIDNFKIVNDTMGHQAGDEFLKSAADRLKKIVKSCDYVCHLGGDEFLLLIRKVTDKKDIENIAKKLLNMFKKPFTVSERNIHYITASMGISIIPQYGYDARILLNYADNAMYHAKKNGKNSYKFYIDEMHSKMSNECKMKDDLKTALTNNEFKVVYQPQVCVKTGELSGLEALIRWKRKNGQLIMPSKFVDFAKKKGVLASIDEHVLKTVCIQSALWEKKGYKSTKISINLSGCELADERLFMNIEKTLNNTGICPSFLEIQATENMIMKNFDLAVKTLNKLKNIGVKIALDNFGTGYSSINCVKNLPIDFVKIDKSIISKILKDSKERFLVDTLIKLFHGFDVKVIAEGVENLEQFKLLKTYECDEIQGFLFSKPISEIEIENMLKCGVIFNT